MSIQKRMLVLSTFMASVVCAVGTVWFYYSYNCLSDFARMGGKGIGGGVYVPIVLFGCSMSMAAIFLLYTLRAIGRDLQRGTQAVDRAIFAIRTAFEDRGCCPGAATLSPNEGIDHLTLSLKEVMEDIQKQIAQTGFEEFREILRNIHACLSIHTEKIAFIGAGVKNTSNQLLRQEAIWSGLLDISCSITSDPAFQDAVQRVVETIRNLTQSYGIIVMTLHEERQLIALVFTGYTAEREYDIDSLRITLDDPSLSARALRTRAVQWAYSVEEDEEYLKIDDRVRTEVIIPLYHGEHALGVMVVSFDRKCRRNENFLSMLAPLSAYLSAYLEVLRVQTELRSSYEYLVRKFQQIADLYNHETAEHLERVSRCSGMAASWLGCSVQEQRDIVVFSRTHDLGKIRVPTEILLKPCGLTAKEYEIVKKHTIWGAELIGDAEWLSIARNICLTHHERWNGTGYPYGQRGKKIPLEGRIVALMDVYDALRSERPYKNAYPHEEAVTIILEGDGRVMPEHFDPDILAFFRHNHREMERVYDETSLP